MLSVRHHGDLKLTGGETVEIAGGSDGADGNDAVADNVDFVYVRCLFVVLCFVVLLIGSLLEHLCVEWLC